MTSSIDCSWSNCWYVGMLTLMANSIGSQILKGLLSWVYQASVHLISDEQGAHKDQSPTNCHQMCYWSVSNFKLDWLRRAETSWLCSIAQNFSLNWPLLQSTKDEGQLCLCSGHISGQYCCSLGLKDQLQSKSSRCSALQQDINRNSGNCQSGSLGNAMHAVPKIGPSYVATGPRLPVATLVSQVSIWGVCNTTTMYNADIRSINLRYHPALGNSPEAIAVWS